VMTSVRSSRTPPWFRSKVGRRSPEKQA
jgi:hypothetical protein